MLRAITLICIIVLLSLPVVTAQDDIFPFTGLINDDVIFHEIPFVVSEDNSTVEVTMERGYGDLDTLIYLLDDSGIIIGTNDDAQRGDQTQSYLRQLGLQAGDYTVVATRYKLTQGDTTGGFSLTITVSPYTEEIQDYDVSVETLIATGYPEFETKAEADWTILVYYGADTNLEGALINDLDEFERSGGSTDSVHIVALIDRSPLHSESNENWTGVKVFDVTSDVSNDYDELDVATIDTQELAYLHDPDTGLHDLDTGNGETLAQFLVWGMTQFPAKNYAVVFGSHGAAWEGLITDETAPNSSETVADIGDVTILGLGELQAAFELVLDTTGHDKFALLINDACFMSSLEYFSVMQHYFDFSYASPEVVVNPALDMFQFANVLKETPDANLENLGIDLVDYYMTWDMVQKAGTSIKYLTNSVTNLNNFGGVDAALDDFAQLMTNDMDRYVSLLGQARANTYGYPAGTGNYTLIDVGDFMQQVITRTTNPDIIKAAHAVLDALDQALVYGNAGERASESTYYYNIYFPEAQKEFDNEYIERTSLRSWALMLQTFYNTLTPQIWTRDETFIFHVPLSPTVDVTRVVPDIGGVFRPFVINLEVTGRLIAEGEFTVDWVQDEATTVRVYSRPMLTQYATDFGVSVRENMWQSGIDTREERWDSNLFTVTDGTTTDYELVVINNDGQLYLEGRYRTDSEEEWSDVGILFDRTPDEESLNRILLEFETIQPEVGDAEFDRLFNQLASFYAYFEMPEGTLEILRRAFEQFLSLDFSGESVDETALDALFDTITSANSDFAGARRREGEREIIAAMIGTQPNKYEYLRILSAFIGGLPDSPGENIPNMMYRQPLISYGFSFPQIVISHSTGVSAIARDSGSSVAGVVEIPAGSTFQTYQYVVTPDGGLQREPHQTYIWNKSGIFIQTAPAPSGKYELGFLITAFGGNTGFGSAPVEIDNDGVGENLEQLKAYTAAEDGFILRYLSGTPLGVAALTVHPEGSGTAGMVFYFYPGQLDFEETDPLKMLEHLVSENPVIGSVGATTLDDLTPITVDGHEAYIFDITEGFELQLPSQGILIPTAPRRYLVFAAIPAPPMAPEEYAEFFDVEANLRIMQDTLVLFEPPSLDSHWTRQSINRPSAFIGEPAQLPVYETWLPNAFDNGIWSGFALDKNPENLTFAAVTQLYGAENTEAVLDALLLAEVQAGTEDFTETDRRQYSGEQYSWQVALYTVTRDNQTISGRLYVTYAAETDIVYAVWFEAPQETADLLFSETFELMLDGFSIPKQSWRQAHSDAGIELRYPRSQWSSPANNESGIRSRDDRIEYLLLLVPGVDNAKDTLGKGLMALANTGGTHGPMVLIQQQIQSEQGRDQQTPNYRSNVGARSDFTDDIFHDREAVSLKYTTLIGTQQVYGQATAIYLADNEIGVVFVRHSLDDTTTDDLDAPNTPFYNMAFDGDWIQPTHAEQIDDNVYQWIMQEISTNDMLVGLEIPAIWDKQPQATGNEHVYISPSEQTTLRLIEVADSGQTSKESTESLVQPDSVNEITLAGQPALQFDYSYESDDETITGRGLALTVPEYSSTSSIILLFESTPYGSLELVFNLAKESLHIVTDPIEETVLADHDELFPMPNATFTYENRELGFSLEYPFEWFSFIHGFDRLQYDETNNTYSMSEPTTESDYTGMWGEAQHYYVQGGTPPTNLNIIVVPYLTLPFIVSQRLERDSNRELTGDIELISIGSRDALTYMTTQIDDDGNRQYTHEIAVINRNGVGLIFSINSSDYEAIEPAHQLLVGSLVIMD
jgi:hypothetical protein